MKIVIAGQAKSGTTMLYYRLSAALSGDYKTYFEPRSIQAENITNALAKILIRPFRQPITQVTDFDGFEKKILIVRDPRDTLISALLYFGAFFEASQMTPEEYAALLKLIDKKRQSPNQVSVRELFKQFHLEDYLDELPETIDTLTDFAVTHKYFIVKYEDVINDQIDDLQRYLNFSLPKKTFIAKQHERVIRTKGCSDWKNWFTLEDCEYFDKIFSKFYAIFNYHPISLENYTPILLEEYSNNYIHKVVTDVKEHHLPTNIKD